MLSRYLFIPTMLVVLQIARCSHSIAGSKMALTMKVLKLSMIIVVVIYTSTIFRFQSDLIPIRFGTGAYSVIMPLLVTTTKRARWLPDDAYELDVNGSAKSSNSPTIARAANNGGAHCNLRRCNWSIRWNRWFAANNFRIGNNCYKRIRLKSQNGMEHKSCSSLEIYSSTCNSRFKEPSRYQYLSGFELVPDTKVSPQVKRRISTQHSR